MKTAAKVFLIIAMVLEFPLIFPVVIGVCTINKINTAKKASELTGWGIASMILVGFLGGLFTLCIKDSDLNPYPPIVEPHYIKDPYKEVEQKQPVTSEAEEAKEEPSYIDNIKELKKLYDEGILTEEEFTELKKEQLEK